MLVEASFRRISTASSGRGLGYRFWNHDVLNDVDAVLAAIENHIKSPHPDPLPEGEGIGKG
jgi:hypothetical protein